MVPESVFVGSEITLAQHVLEASLLLNFRPGVGCIRWTHGCAAGVHHLASTIGPVVATSIGTNTVTAIAALIQRPASDHTPLFHGVGAAGYPTQEATGSAMHAFTLVPASQYLGAGGCERLRVTGHHGAWRWVMPLPVMDGGRWLVVQVRGIGVDESTPLNHEPMMRGMSLLMVAVASSYRRAVLDPEIRERALYDRLPTPQREVARLLMLGKTEQAIADEVHRSRHTVHDHVRGIYERFGVKSRHEFLVLWRELLDAE